MLRAEHPSEPVFTTGCWYVRLTQAVLRRGAVRGRLSTPFDELPDRTRQRALEGLFALPAGIDIVDWRTIGPEIARMKVTHQLNLLGAEAVASAVHLDLPVALSARSPRLEAALDAEGVEVLPVSA